MIGALGNHLWQSTVFALAAAAVALLLRRNQARIRHAVWLAASVKFLVPFALLINLGSQLEWHAPARAAGSALVSTVVLQASEPFAAASIRWPAQPAPDATSLDWLALVLVVVWGLGFAGVVMVRVRGWRLIRAALRSATPSRLGARGGVNILSAPAPYEPGVVGWWRPVILLPAGIEDHLTSRQLETVLAHERCHVRRRDNLTASLHMVVEALFWFYPPVWWIGARLIDERERACDEAVLSELGEHRSYAEAIVAVCRRYVDAPLGCVPGVGGSEIKQRIEAIMANRIGVSLSISRKAVLAAVLMAAIAAPVVVGAIDGQAAPGQPAASAAPRFEVASIRRCDTDGAPIGPSRTTATGPTQSPGRLYIPCGFSVSQLVLLAYFGGTQIYDFTNPEFPAWTRAESYEINAVAEGNPSRATMQGPMLQALLEDRFKLRTRRESRTIPAYALTVSAGGSKLTALPPGSCLEIDPSNPPPERPQGRLCGASTNRPDGGNWMFAATGIPITRVINLLTQAMDRPVVDRTGLTGIFDLRLDFSPEGTRLGERLRDLNAAGALPEATAPPLVTALQEQLGLKLESIRGSWEFLVVEAIERPTEN